MAWPGTLQPTVASNLGKQLAIGAGIGCGGPASCSSVVPSVSAMVSALPRPMSLKRIGGGGLIPVELLHLGLDQLQHGEALPIVERRADGAWARTKGGAQRQKGGAQRQKGGAQPATEGE